MEININIAPKELIVGISGNLCYVTYKDSRGKLNSEKSWSNWSDNYMNPLIIENKFAEGFKLGGVNGRWSRQAANAENLLIEHPLFNKCFEISMHRFIEIAEKCTIINGVIQAEMIMTNDRNIVFKDEYEAAVNEFEKQEALKAKTKEKNLQKKVKSSGQVPSKIYIDIKNNSEYCYLGSATVDGILKYIYISASQVQEIYKTSKFDYYSGVNKRDIVELKHPKILIARGKRLYTECEFDELFATAKNTIDLFNLYESYYLRITSTKLSTAESNDDRNIYDSYTEEDWEMVNLAYNKDYKSSNSGKRNYNKESILKGVTAINHFREDYLKFKN